MFIYFAREEKKKPKSYHVLERRLFKSQEKEEHKYVEEKHVRNQRDPLHALMLDVREISRTDK